MLVLEVTGADTPVSLTIKSATRATKPAVMKLAGDFRFYEI